MKKNLLMTALFILLALPAVALPDAQWTYDYYDENGNLVGRKDIWCGGIQTTGTVTDRYCVLYWGPCDTMEPWLGCASEGWSDKPGDCGQCMSAGYEDSYNYCITTDCNGNKKPGCPVKSGPRRERPPDRASTVLPPTLGAPLTITAPNNTACIP